MQTKIIGIAGGSASGKTSIVRLLYESVREKAQILYLDAYYKSYDELTFEERTKVNFDHPDSFEVERLVHDLKELKAGHAIDMPVYDYVGYTRKPETITIRPCEVILVEGLLVLYYPELRALLDLKVFVETDSDERLMRRIRRDTIKRKRTLESVLDQYQNTVKPMHEQFIEPSKKFADVIIPVGAKNTRGVELLMNYLRQTLHT